MVSLTRTTTDGVVAPSRDSTVSSVWRDLNRVALRVGTGAGFAAGAGYMAAFAATGDRAFLLSVILGLSVGFSGVYSTLRGSADVELLIVTAGVAVAVSSSLPEPASRGGLWGVIAVLAMMGSLLLPDHKQPRLRIWIGLLLLSQLLWPAIGFATATAAISSVVISTASVATGIVIVTVAKRALAASEQTRLKIFRSVPVGLFRCAPTGELIDANPAMAQMLGNNVPEDLIGHQIADLHEKSDEWNSLAGSLEESHEPQRFAHRMVHAHGNALWVRGFAQAIRDDDGSVLYFEGSIEDVTQRHEAEEISRLHAERFKNVFERAPIAIWEEDFSRAGRRIETLRALGVTDLRTHLDEHPEEVRRLLEMIEFIDVNPAGIALIGAASKEDALTAVRPETAPAAVVEGFVEEFGAIWEDRDSMLIEIQGATADGGTTDLAMSWAAGRNADGSLDLARVVVAIQDVAIIKKAERELAALVESKDNLIASVSHELRTPITTILGMASELRDRSASFSSDETEELVSFIADQSRELSNIVEDLLVAARTDAGTLTITRERVDLASEINRILATERRASDVVIEERVVAWADPLRMRQILRNLLTNADRYGGDLVSVEAETIGDTAVVRVRDNGVGIPRAERESIFEPYVRSGGDTALAGSIGLGLSVSRTLAHLMDGDLTYRHDGSSVFELSLPTPD